MDVAVLGATGRTGRLVVDELLRRGHTVRVLVRDAARAPRPGDVKVVVGDVKDPEPLRAVIEGADAVVSTLGSTDDRELHRSTVRVLVPLLQSAGVRRFVGVSGAGVDAPGDAKRFRDKLISGAMHRFAKHTVGDKEEELAGFRTSDLDWTFVRPPRLADGAATGRVEHHATVSTKSTTMTTGDLAVLLADVLEQGLYVRQAPFAATAKG